ncbi:GDP-mannose 4/6-dehydratase domain protein [Synechococcus sp. BIOS-U3-1]|nr:GDP-mannose 4/6-dehydratase domain protein [Synechococcus sp. BIOS-U3-1]
MFNHESQRWGETFATRKSTPAWPALMRARQECLFIGNLDFLRDWNNARNYVEM